MTLVPSVRPEPQASGSTFHIFPVFAPSVAIKILGEEAGPSSC
eukprot:CAMPEP_0206480788 /NCGR_PEP_ID=MMETSP0324_2-20121206/37655_1 /ASSEMBLY_ACC=CAM_ASM_000836 /TAXON_ID=2866 /ORGANISM="Crypthecodinium cohnii, Strain Seligo" /LENGTH=42 /DNA_ID= /DNA_START= /DNA_END= /DNA_ORIENTATION=